jgi:hypothetical protein
MLETYVAANISLTVIKHIEFKNLFELLQNEAEIQNKKWLRYLLIKHYDTIQWDLLPGLSKFT